MLKKLAILCLLLSTGARANPAEAERIKRGFELSSEKWMLEMKLATTPEARGELMAERPDPQAAASGLWRIDRAGSRAGLDDTLRRVFPGNLRQPHRH